MFEGGFFGVEYVEREKDGETRERGGTAGIHHLYFNHTTTKWSEERAGPPRRESARASRPIQVRSALITFAL